MAALTTDQILDAIASMTVLEASELVKAMEEKFGVTAAAPVMVAGAGAAPAAAAEEQTEFNVSLESAAADKKIAVIKAVRGITGLGLKEAKDWELVLPCCLTNGNQGYFPMQDAYDEGGYEARSSNFKAGVAELIIQEGIALLDKLH